MRRKWVVAFAAAALALAIAGGAVFAAAHRGDPGPAAVDADRRSDDQDKLLANVAAKLGLDVAKVKAAQQQAARAVEAEQRTRLLNDLVEKGRLTREQADALNAWLASRPESAARLPGIPGLPGIAGSGHLVAPTPLWHKPFEGKPGAHPNDVFVKMAALLGKDAAAVAQAFKEANSELANERRMSTVNDQLDRLAKDGVITDQEAAQIKAWIEKAPAFFSDGAAVPFRAPAGPAIMPHRWPMQPGGDWGRPFVPRGQSRFLGLDGTGPAMPFGNEFGPDELEELDELFDSQPDLFRQFGIPGHGRPWAAPAMPVPQPEASPGSKGA